ncbi:MAG: hypothetical protein K6E28_08875 [Eubacterium sp.]|nr:hypothetical protein [Eubacterium sp.]
MDNNYDNNNMNPEYDGQGYDPSQYDQSQYDASQYDQSQYQGYDQSQYDVSQYDQSQYQGYDQSQYDASQYNQSQYQGYDQSQYDQSQYDQSQYDQSQNDQSQYQSYNQSEYQQGYDQSQYQGYDRSEYQQGYDQSQYQAYEQSQYYASQYDQSQYDQSQYEQAQYDQSQYQGYDYSQYNQTQYDQSQYHHESAVTEPAKPAEQITEPAKPAEQITEPAKPAETIQELPEPAGTVYPAETKKTAKAKKDKKPKPEKSVPIEPPKTEVTKLDTATGEVTGKGKKKVKEKKNKKKILVTALITFFATVLLNAGGIAATIYGIRASHKKKAEESMKEFEEWNENYSEYLEEEEKKYEEENAPKDDEEEKKVYTYEDYQAANDVNSTVYDNSKLGKEGTVMTPQTKIIGDYDPDSLGYKYEVSLVGAEYFRTPDGYEAIRIYYDFYNSGERIVYPDDEVQFYAFQGGIELERYLGNYGEWWDKDNFTVGMYKAQNPFTRNATNFMRPGGKTRCAAEFYMDWKYEDTISVKFEHHALANTPLWMSYDLDDPYCKSLETTYCFYTSFEPSQMPLKPESDSYLIPVTDPKWTAGQPTEGDVINDMHIAIGDATFSDEEDGKHIKIHLDYTQLTGNPTSFKDICQLDTDLNFDWPRFIVTQDGAGLNMVRDDETLAVMEQEVGRNETIGIDLEYVLVSNNPVEIAFLEMAPYQEQKPYIGKVFTVQ